MNCEHRAPAHMLKGKKSREDFIIMIDQAEDTVKKNAEMPVIAARMMNVLADAGLYDRETANEFMEILRELSVANEQIRVKLRNLGSKVCARS